MPVVSVSLNEDILEDIDRLQKDLGFSGRSEIIRAGLRTLLEKENEQSSLTGTVHALMLVLHDEKSDTEINEIGHFYDKIVTTHIHNKIEKDKCHEVFLIRGDAESVREMVRKFKINRKVEYVRLLQT